MYNTEEPTSFIPEKRYDLYENSHKKKVLGKSVILLILHLVLNWGSKCSLNAPGHRL